MPTAYHSIVYAEGGEYGRGHPAISSSWFKDEKGRCR
jgi:hypothetical protein